MPKNNRLNEMNVFLFKNILMVKHFLLFYALLLLFVCLFAIKIEKEMA